MNVLPTLVVLYTCIVKTVGNFMSYGVALYTCIEDAMGNFMSHKTKEKYRGMYTCIVETAGNFMSNERIANFGCAIYLYLRSRR